MKDLHDDTSERTSELLPGRVPAFTRLMSVVTGTSRDQLRFVPDAEHRTVVLVGLTLLLVLSASALGWWVALGIARGHVSPWHLPFVALVGGLVYVVDRAMVRQHWVRHGKIQARTRGFDMPNPRANWVAMVIHWFLRVGVSMVLSLTTAGFIELALFENDIVTYRDGQARTANQPIFEAAGRDVDETSAALRTEIDQLDAQVEALTKRTTNGLSASQAAARQQIDDLAAERSDLRARVIQLGTQIDCITRDRIAEEHGGMRCDNTLAVAGTGQRWAIASDQLDYLRAERQRAEARIDVLDGELSRLQSQADPVAAADRERLAELTDRRAEALRTLTAFVSGRTASVNDRAKADPRYTVVVDGLVLRGEALEALAASSPWLATRIWLVFASMAALDLAAVIVLALLPPPLALTVGEVLASETAAHRLIAHHEQWCGAARREALPAREATLREAVETDARLDQLRTTMATRREVSSRYCTELERVLKDQPLRV